MKKILMIFVMMVCLTVNSIAQKSEFFTKGEAEYSNKNYEEAVKWYEKAADEGVADAMYMLGGVIWVAKEWTKTKVRLLIGTRGRQTMEIAK